MTEHILYREGRRVFVFLSFVAVAGIGTQFVLAGIAVFGLADGWGAHAALGGAIGLVVVVMVGLCLASRAVRDVRPMVFALLVLYVVQILLVVVAQSGTLPLLGALHPLNGVVMAFIAVEILRKAS